MNDERLLYVALAGIGGFMGLSVALSQPVTGFFITGITIVFSLLGLMVNLKNSVSDKLPSLGNRTISENRMSVIVGVLTLVSFIPFLLPEIMLAVGLLLFLVGVLMAYIQSQQNSSISISDEDLGRVLLGALIFAVAYEVNFLLIFAPALMFAWFLWTLLSKDNQQSLMEVMEK